MKLISIEGNIGSGKSTILYELALRLPRNYHIVMEPVEEWENYHGCNMIEKLYSDPERHGFEFQLMVFTTRLAHLKREMARYPNSVLVCERSLQTDIDIFATMLLHDKPTLMATYMAWVKLVDIPRMDHVIYIDTPPELAYERCIRRSREGEQNITMSYLQHCHVLHENWIKPSMFVVENLNLSDSVHEVESILYALAKPRTILHFMHNCLQWLVRVGMRCVCLHHW